MEKNIDIEKTNLNKKTIEKFLETNSIEKKENSKTKSNNEDEKELNDFFIKIKNEKTKKIITSLEETFDEQDSKNLEERVPKEKLKSQEDKSPYSNKKINYSQDSLKENLDDKYKDNFQRIGLIINEDTKSKVINRGPSMRLSEDNRYSPKAKQIEYQEQKRYETLDPWKKRLDEEERISKVF